jgi:16S rRNA (guanine966-N2)-methyltransferase
VRVPKGDLRPSAERVREALFARLDVEDASVLELFAGSGVLGLEAISRGARSVLFVDRSPHCVATLRESVRALGVEGAVEVETSDAVRAVVRLGHAGRRFDLVLMDPPYASDAAPRVLAELVGSGVLAKGSLVVVEHGRRHPVPVVAGLSTLDERRYGDTAVTRLRPREGEGDGRG